MTAPTSTLAPVDAAGLPRRSALDPVAPAVTVLYEHPEWFRPLFAELERRDVPFRPLHAADLTWDPAETAPTTGIVINRMSPSAWTRGQAGAIFHTLHYLDYLDALGVPVINAAEAFRVELSKARQLTLMAQLGIRHPASRVIAHPSQAVAAANELTWPVVVKPNIGGSGAGITSFADADELAEAAADDGLTFGIDGVAIVQEHLPAAGDQIVRIEILGDRYLYAIRLLLTPGSFNLCPADYCELPGLADGVSGRGLPIEAFEAPAALVEDARRLVAAAGMDLGGVEYLISDRDGEAYIYDVNALSNFVADAPNVVGFDPFVDLVDFILARADAVAAESRVA
jgi:glutathione synthase/RimK-type ligase-like ATP-grasp enzyme